MRSLPFLNCFLLVLFLIFFLPSFVYSADFIHQNFSVTYPLETLDISSGDIIVRNKFTNSLSLSAAENSPNVFGVVAENPPLVFRTNSGSVPVMRFGQTDVKVILKNGSIKKGDYITTSDVIGHGMAMEPQHRYIVGVALEALNQDDAENYVLASDGQSYPAGLILIDLKIGLYGSGVISIKNSDFIPDPSTIGITQMFSHDTRIIQDFVGGFLETSSNFLATEVGGNIVRFISTSGVISGFFAGISAFFLSPSAIFQIFLLPFRLWALLMAFLGFKKKQRSWGVVYDSVTKQPIDPAYVLLEDEKGNEIKTAITDIDGRYGFLVEEGKYRLKANKTNYKFPSEKLKGRLSDEIYNNLYFGEVFSVGEKGDLIIKNIPMDPENFDWNEFNKLNKNILTYYSYGEFFKAVLLNWFFYIGFVVSIIALVLSFSIYNIVILALYVLVFFLRLIGPKPHRYGKVLKAKNGKPYSYAIVKVFMLEGGRETYKTVCDMNGRYLSLVTNGDYYVKIDRKNQEGFYEHIYTSNPFKVKNGVIDKVFRV
jgi:hypothetical protein